MRILYFWLPNNQFNRFLIYTTLRCHFNYVKEFLQNISYVQLIAIKSIHEQNPVYFNCLQLFDINF